MNSVQVQMEELPQLTLILLLEEQLLVEAAVVNEWEKVEVEEAKEQKVDVLCGDLPMLQQHFLPKIVRICYYCRTVKAI